LKLVAYPKIDNTSPRHGTSIFLLEDRVNDSQLLHRNFKNDGKLSQEIKNCKYLLKSFFESLDSRHCRIGRLPGSSKTLVNKGRNARAKQAGPVAARWIEVENPVATVSRRTETCARKKIPPIKPS
jgi:hypothetical protein